MNNTTTTTTLSPNQRTKLVKEQERSVPCIELHPDTKILTPKGFQPLAKLQVGDSIINLHNKVKQIISLEVLDVESAYVISFTNNTRLVCSKNTTLALKTIRQHRDFSQLGLLPISVIKEIDSIKNTGNEYKWQIPHYEGLHYTTHTTIGNAENDFYVDGFLFGCLIRTQTDVRLTSRYLESIRKVLNKNLYERFNEGVRIRAFDGLKNSFRCTANLQLHLFKLESYKHDDRLLFELLSETLENRIAFVEGVSDSRGGTGKIISKDKAFLRVVGLVAQSVGLQVLYPSYKETQTKESITLKLFKSLDGDLLSPDVGSILKESTSHVRVADIKVTTTTKQVIRLIVADKSDVIADTFLRIGG